MFYCDRYSTIQASSLYLYDQKKQAINNPLLFLIKGHHGVNLRDGGFIRSQIMLARGDRHAGGDFISEQASGRSFLTSEEIRA